MNLALESSGAMNVSIRTISTRSSPSGAPGTSRHSAVAVAVVLNETAIAAYGMAGRGSSRSRGRSDGRSRVLFCFGELIEDGCRRETGQAASFPSEVSLVRVSYRARKIGQTAAWTGSG